MTAETLPALRNDLELIEGEQDASGARSFLVRDVVRNTFVSVSADTCLLLAHWRAGVTPAAFAASMKRVGVDVSAEQVRQFAAFLSRAELVVQSHVGLFERAQAARKAHTFGKRLFHGYLFFKIPLVYPNQFLNRTKHLVAPLYSRGFRALLALLLAFDLLFLIPRWDQMTGSLLSQGAFEILFKFGLAFVCAKLVHEFAHAYTAVREGCFVSSLGIGFMFGVPVFYADVTDTWRLADHRERLRVSSAGVASELGLAIIATALWLIDPVAALSQVFLYLAMATWISSLLINLNPLMRFDGYYILSDMLAEKNLQQKAFGAMRTRLRAMVGFRVPADTATRYAWLGALTAAYRVMVVTAIAVALYSFSFRLLALVLFAAEIWWFLLRPVAQEARAGWRDRAFVAKPRFFAAVATLALLAGLGLFVPISTQVSAPAVLLPERTSRIFARDGGVAVALAPGAPRDMFEGDVLLHLVDPALDLQRRQLHEQAALLEERRKSISLAVGDRSAALSLEAEIQSVRSKEAAIVAQIEAMRVRAPHDGRFVPVERIEQGAWVSARAPLGDIISGGARIVAFVAERDLASVAEGARASFFDDLLMARIEGRVAAISYAASPTVAYPELSSVYGGAILARLVGQGRIISEKAVYRVDIEIAAPRPDARITGSVLIATAPRSYYERLSTWVSALIVREAYIN